LHPWSREAKQREHRAGSGQPEVLDEVLSQDVHGHGVEQQRARPGETGRASLRVEFQKLLVIQFLDAHRPPPSDGTSIRLKEPHLVLIEPRSRKPPAQCKRP
jgi:hypothetical protein